ncbi:MAG: NADP-dependent isocitrate dehydrogenase [Alphaproteobacteria bacterium]
MLPPTEPVSARPRPLAGAVPARNAGKPAGDAGHERTAAKPAPVTVSAIAGDGIGPEVMAAVQRMVAALDPSIRFEACTAGAAAFSKGVTTGVPKETLASIARHRVVLKSPLETPIGHGGKSANVTLRKYFETYGNIRPARELPGIVTPFSGRGIDLVVVRENVEDVYAGIEHMQTPSVAQCLKLNSRKGCEKIARLAFELARAEARKAVTCVHKANIMKLTEGLFTRVFDEVAADYPDIEAGHMIVDNCAHRLVITPERFDVIVATNMNGDILSDLTAGLIGGLGLAPSANLGDGIAMFEAVHGSAPDIAGQDKANPTALALAAAMMLRHLGRFEAAETLEHTLFRTIAVDGVRTGDIAGKAQATGTAAFTDRVIENIGSRVEGFSTRPYRPLAMPKLAGPPAAPKRRALVGVDVFVETTAAPEALGERLAALAQGTPFRLKIIESRGAQVYPASGAETDVIDHFRCRFVANDNASLGDADVLALLGLIGTHYGWMHVEKLQSFDGAPTFTLAAGES